MPQQLTDRRDQEFVIWKQINCTELLKYEKYKESNQKTCDMIITEAGALAIKELLPLLAEGDAQGMRYENGEVKVPQSFHRVSELILEGEWNNLGVSVEQRDRARRLFWLQLPPNIFWQPTGCCSVMRPWAMVPPI